ncbi:hypothetical protein PVAG01_06496 [Phlyctema vagabunda]|uniref:Uncharacterized protein n=1 Tax=Phlyctema vagabunda TaxID=108571 RepID=A0ABR4PG93_9HELO
MAPSTKNPGKQPQPSEQTEADHQVDLDVTTELREQVRHEKAQREMAEGFLRETVREAKGHAAAADKAKKALAECEEVLEATERDLERATKEANEAKEQVRVLREQMEAIHRLSAPIQFLEALGSVGGSPEAPGPAASPRLQQHGSEAAGSGSKHDSGSERGGKRKSEELELEGGDGEDGDSEVVFLGHKRAKTEEEYEEWSKEHDECEEYEEEEEYDDEEEEEEDE